MDGSDERVKPKDGSELEPRPHAVDIYERICDDTVEELRRPAVEPRLLGPVRRLHDRAGATRVRARAGHARRRRLGEVRRRAALPDRLHRRDRRPGPVLHREHALPGDGLDAKARVPAHLESPVGDRLRDQPGRRAAVRAARDLHRRLRRAGPGEVGRRGRRRHRGPAQHHLLERRGHRLAAGAGRLAGRGLGARDRPDRRDLRDHLPRRPRRLRPLHRDHGGGVLRPVRGPALARRPARLARRDQCRQHRRRGDDRRRDQLRPGSRRGRGLQEPTPIASRTSARIGAAIPRAFSAPAPRIRSSSASSARSSP